MKELKLTVVGLDGVVLALLAAAAPLALATEGGTSHVQPGANATLVDLPPTTPGWFFKPMYINYRGNVSARNPTAAGIVTNAKAEANTLALGGGYGFEQTVLGAHYGGIIGHFLLILAYRRAPAASLMSLLYVQIAFAMLAGWLVFRHVPDGWSLLGMGLIAFCGAASAWLAVLETRLKIERLEV